MRHINVEFTKRSPIVVILTGLLSRLLFSLFHFIPFVKTHLFLWNQFITWNWLSTFVANCCRPRLFLPWRCSLFASNWPHFFHCINKLLNFPETSVMTHIQHLIIMGVRKLADKFYSIIFNCHPTKECYFSAIWQLIALCLSVYSFHKTLAACI